MCYLTKTYYFTFSPVVVILGIILFLPQILDAKAVESCPPGTQFAYYQHGYKYCEPCPDTSYQDQETYNDEKCKVKTICPYTEGKYTLHEGNSTMDRKCACRKGYSKKYIGTSEEFICMFNNPENESEVLSTVSEELGGQEANTTEVSKISLGGKLGIVAVGVSFVFVIILTIVCCICKGGVVPCAKGLLQRCDSGVMSDQDITPQTEQSLLDIKIQSECSPSDENRLLSNDSETEEKTSPLSCSITKNMEVKRPPSSDGFSASSAFLMDLKSDQNSDITSCVQNHNSLNANTVQDAQASTPGSGSPSTNGDITTGVQSMAYSESPSKQYDNRAVPYQTDTVVDNTLDLASSINLPLQREESSLDINTWSSQSQSEQALHEEETGLLNETLHSVHPNSSERFPSSSALSLDLRSDQNSDSTAHQNFASSSINVCVEPNSPLQVNIFKGNHNSIKVSYNNRV